MRIPALHPNVAWLGHAWPYLMFMHHCLATAMQLFHSQSAQTLFQKVPLLR